ncbi:CD99 antigen isoform X2 [Talpa occidentalis]|uniref:CD99 antigen isoform X2 n=1 Tax=Talpa occidentalis TaxID=50954 RepID=UPI00188F261A|nr:CD99 antigen isoform X2 [Talpa occidentalis]
MSRRVAVALLLLGLLGWARPDQGDDLSLWDALDDSDKKPTAAPKKPSAGDDFNLEDALGGGGERNDPRPTYRPRPKPNPHPNPNPNPKQPGSSGGFSDSDLFDGTADGGGGGRGGHGGRAGPDEHDNTQNGGAPQADSPGVLSGIIGSVVVAVVGAVSSFIAYQKKKLCFKESGGATV